MATVDELIAWCGFLGGWLLVAGPIYQAAIELDDEEFERSDFEAAVASVEPPEPVSRWWLLVPPLAYLVHRRRHERRNRALMAALSARQIEQLMHFREKASAWIFVASGAFLIATKETWELRETYEWSVVAFWAIVVGMVMACAVNTVMRIKRREDILREGRTHDARSS